jgi:hypothetical protein
MYPNKIVIEEVESHRVRVVHNILFPTYLCRFLDGKGGGGMTPANGDSSRNNSPQPKTENGLRPLDYLQASHEA